MFLVDLWDSVDNDFFYSKFENQDFDAAFNKVESRFDGRENVKIIKGDSKKVHSLFDDEFFDWIYIDGDHSYEGVSTDLKNWISKVKMGGVISGHDFDPDPTWSVTSNFGVNRAISDFFLESDDLHLTNEKHYRSWVYLKNRLF